MLDLSDRLPGKEGSPIIGEIRETARSLDDGAQALVSSDVIGARKKDFTRDAYPFDFTPIRNLLDMNHVQGLKLQVMARVSFQG